MIGKNEMHGDDQIVLDLLMKAAKIYASSDVSMSRKEALRKNNSARDVVTNLDISLHKELSMLGQEGEDRIIVSEEGFSNKSNLEVYVADTLLIDPLDGSFNYAKGLNLYCTIVALIRGKKIVQSGVCLPIERQISTWNINSNVTKFTKVIDKASITEGATYYAYPPFQSDNDILLRQKIMNSIDEMSSGLMRWGSSGSGLYYLMTGVLQSFVGHKIRIWDGLAFLPMLASFGIKVAYKIDGTDLLMVASRNEKHFSKLCEEMLKAGHELSNYKVNIELNL
jgi:myo-inositol-1(or 4)-monophosphatase